ncbi:MAG: AMP-binding protein [Candidatus Rokubacteria bacterium]|nr:AMP-binding protein [Candidatus Rokubacteria bacterium]
MHIVGNRTLRTALEQKVAAQPDKTFVVFEDAAGGVQRYTYAEFDAQVNRTANLLADLGVGHGDKFNVHLPNCPEFLFWWFAGAKLGAVMVPTNVLEPPEAMAYLLGFSESRIAVTQPEYLGAIAPVRARCPALRHVVLCRTEQAEPGTLGYDAQVAGRPATAPDARVTPRDECAMCFTSGTTSRPKGCLITHANYVYVGESVSKSLRVAPDDRHMVVLPLFHVHAQYYQTMTALVVGASLALMERFSASRYFDQVIAHQATVGGLFAAPIRMILAQPRRPGHRRNALRIVQFAMSVTAAQLDEWHERFGAPLVQMYGMTETIGQPTINPLDAPRKNMSIGTVALGYECRVVDETGREVPPGVEGQLVVRGEPGITLMKGYYKNPEATAATIRDGWLRTGDVVRMDEDGYFWFVDRAGDLIKRGGENVSAGEVEAVLKQHPAVFDAAVVGVPDAMRDEAVLACVVLRDDARVTAEELIAFCEPRLAKFKVPEIVEFRDELPRTPVGKIQKHRLRAEARAKHEVRG